MRNIVKIPLLGVCFLFLLMHSLFGDFSAGKIRFTPLPVATYLKTQKNPPLDKYIEAALSFSGVPDAKLQFYTEKMDSVVAAVKTGFQGKNKTAALCDELLVFLHERYLKQYREKETSMDALLDRGIFNCVSSSVFYMIAVLALDIPVTGVKTSSHAFCVVTVGGKSYDVETTSKFGFNPHGKREFLDEFGTQTGFVYVPPGNYADRSTITPIHLLTLILNNCVAMDSEHKKYDKALNCAVDMFEVLQSDVSFQVLSGTLSNLSNDALDHQKYEDGLEVLDRAISVYHGFSELAEIRRIYLKNWIGGLINAGKPDDAAAVLLRNVKTGKITQDDVHLMQEYIAFKQAEIASGSGNHIRALEIIGEAVGVLGETAGLRKALIIYSKNAIIDYTNNGEYGNAMALLDSAKKNELLDAATHDDLLVYFYQKKAGVPAREKHFRKALDIINDGLKQLPKNPKLYQSGSTFAYNYTLDLLHGSQYEAVERFLADPEAAMYLDENKRMELWEYLYSEKATVQKNKNGYLAAAQVMEQGIERLGLRPQLVKSYEVYIHNGIVGLVNSREYKKAEQIIINALRIVPRSTRLKNDLETVRKMPG